MHLASIFCSAQCLWLPGYCPLLPGQLFLLFLISYVCILVQSVWTGLNFINWFAPYAKQFAPYAKLLRGF